MFQQAFGLVFGVVFGFGLAVIALICVMEIVDGIEGIIKQDKPSKQP